MVRSEKTRQLIIEKTASIFNKRGYTGTYLSDLTDATGLTKGSIYGNFKDKNEVALEAFRYNYRFQSEKVLVQIEKEKRADRKILVLLNHYKQAYLPIFKNGGCAILNTAVDTDDGNDLLRQEVIEKINGWVHKIASIIKMGIERNEIKLIDATEYTFRTIALIEGSILLSKTLDKPDILLNNIDFLKKELKQLIIK